MAGLKKNKRSKETGGPNLVLVLFLIMFVISNIILGLWLYFNQTETTNALKKASDQQKVSTADRDAMKVYSVMADDLRQAMGQKLNGDELSILEVNRKDLLAGKYDKVEVKNLDTYKKLIEKLRNDLGFDEATGEYKNTYETKADKALKEAQDSQGNLIKVQKQLDGTLAQFKTIGEKQDAFEAATTARFDKDQKAVLTKADKKTEEMNELIKANLQLNQEIADRDQKLTKLDKMYRSKIKDLEATAAAKDAERADAGTAVRDNREPHALLLDVSLGKPLWDDPVGTVTRVDAKAKEVTINIGSAKGAQTGMTFSVFAPSSYVATRPEEQLKGTIEVTRVLGPNASLARITQQYKRRDKLTGEDRDNPLHEGDLLFNLFWGTHVAVAGYVDVTGIASESPSEQQRQLNDFLYLLGRQGIVVDAYLDLTDGQIKGAITQNTRYLIRGDDLRIDPKDVENKEPRAERAVAVNNGVITMRKDAIDRGIFVISARNFANVIGYHMANGGNEKTAFRPGLPTAGSVLPGLTGGVGGIGGVREMPPMPMPMPEPKEKGEPKEKEKG